MTNEKTFKREDGTQYNIIANFHINSYTSLPEYRITCYVKEKGKRKWRHLPDEMSEWEYRRLPFEERESAKYKNYLRFVTEEEIQETKLELWEKLKP